MWKRVNNKLILFFFNLHKLKLKTFYFFNQTIFLFLIFLTLFATLNFYFCTIFIKITTYLYYCKYII